MRKNAYSNEIADAVKMTLEEKGWDYSFDEEAGIFDFTLRYGKKIGKIVHLIGIQEHSLVVYGFCPLRACCDDENMMARMAEFICRVNYGMLNGSFDLDFNDGEIRFKSFVDCDGMIPSKEIIMNSIYCVDAMFNHYAEGIAAIIFFGSTAKRAIDMSRKSRGARLSWLLSMLESDPDNAETAAEIRSRLGLIDEETFTIDISSLDTDIFDDKKPEVL